MFLWLPKVSGLAENGYTFQKGDVRGKVFIEYVPIESSWLPLVGKNFMVINCFLSFGASGHLVLKMAKFQYPDSKIYVFARNQKERQFALKLGANWAGYTSQRAPQKLHGIMDTTPVWKPVVKALANLEKGVANW